MNRKILHTPDGMRDIYSDECEKKIVLEERISSVMKLYGCVPIETPTIEFFDVFSSAIGTTPSRELYKFFDREGNTLVLRPDFTPSIARAASRYFTNPGHPIRLCYKGNTFINHSSYKGRLQEVTQMGVELISDPSVDADAEMIALVIRSLISAGLDNFQISLGHVQYFEALADAAGLEDVMKEELKELIHNKNSFGVEQLLEKTQVTPSVKDALRALPLLFGGNDMLLKTIESCPVPYASRALHRLMQVYEILKLYHIEEYVSFDLGMMSNFMYYTGIIFRGYTYGTGDAIVKGGRYDHLLEQFGMQAPSIGFVIVIDELMNAMNRQKIAIALPDERIYLLYHRKGRSSALQRAEEYRRDGIAVVMIPADDDADLAALSGTLHPSGGQLQIMGD